MVSKKNALMILIGVVLLVGIVHFLLHVAIFGTGVSGFYRDGAGKISLFGFNLFESFKQQYSFYSLPSKIILLVEVLFLVFLVFVFYFSRREDVNDDKEITALKEKYMNEKHTTDLDVLYNILIERKRIDLKSISKIFGVTSEVSENWCQVLESGNLAVIHSPRIGDREVIIAQ